MGFPLFCDRLHQIGLATPSRQTNFLWLVSWIGLCTMLSGAQTKRGGLQPYLPASRFFCATEAVDDRLNFLVKNKAGIPELAALAELRALTPFFKKPDTPLTFIGALSDLKCRAPWFFPEASAQQKKFRRRRCSNGTPPKKRAEVWKMRFLRIPPDHHERRFSKCRFSAELGNVEKFFKMGAASKNKSKKPWAFFRHAEFDAAIRRHRREWL